MKVPLCFDTRIAVVTNGTPHRKLPGEVNAPRGLQQQNFTYTLPSSDGEIPLKRGSEAAIFEREIVVSYGMSYEVRSTHCKVMQIIR